MSSYLPKERPKIGHNKPSRDWTRVVRWSTPDRDPEVDIDRIPGLRDALTEELKAAKERLFYEAPTPRIEKIVQGERLE